MIRSILFALCVLWLVFFGVKCEPAPCEHKWGYYTVDLIEFQFTPRFETPKGISYDVSDPNWVSPYALDAMTDEVEACLGRPIDRKGFVVKVPDDWQLSCDGMQQVLNVRTHPAGCRLKGQEPTPECPCRYRAVIQCPNLIVVTPNLLLFKDALTRFETGSSNPWEDSHLSQCASP